MRINNDCNTTSIPTKTTPSQPKTPRHEHSIIFFNEKCW